MPVRRGVHDDWHDPFDPEDDFDDETDEEYDVDDEASIVPCQYCREPIHEDAERCPYCDRYISAEDAPTSHKPWWILLGAAACLYLVYRWTMG